MAQDSVVLLYNGKENGVRMEQRIEVMCKAGLNDSVGEQVKRRIMEELGIGIKECRYVDVYSFCNEMSADELLLLAREAFSDCISQEFAVEKPAFMKHWRIEISKLPGNEGNMDVMAREAVFEAIGKKIDVRHSRMYAIGGEISHDACDSIARILHNLVVETYSIYLPDELPKPQAHKIESNEEPSIQRISLHMSERRFHELMSQRMLSISVEEFKTIKRYFKKDKVIEERKRFGLDTRITDAELEIIARIWSEQCRHKIFNAAVNYRENDDNHAINSVFKTFIVGATEQIKKPYLVSAFKDNSGIIKFNPNYDLAIKVETYNAGPALEPYAGTLGGVLAVQRDILGTGLGAEPLASMDVICIGPFDAKDAPKGVISPGQIFHDAVRGIADGGNKTGVPTVNGSIVIDRSYLCQPLVCCGSIGIMPSEIQGKRTNERYVEPGHFAVMVGGKIGRENIHGPAFPYAPGDRTKPHCAVPVSNPVIQKRMSDFLIEARDNRLYDAINNCGNGGMANSIGELAQICGGCEIWINKFPLKYPGLEPWEILLSESPDITVLVVHPDKMELLKKLSERHDIDVCTVGKFTKSKRFHAMYNEESAAYIDMRLLYEGTPQMKLFASWRKLVFPEPVLTSEPVFETLKRLLSSQNITAKDNVVTRLDHEVKGQSVIKPFMRGPSDAAVIRPIADSNEGIVISHGICPRIIQDSYAMACIAFDEAVRNALAVGARFGYLACTNNFCWPDPIKSDKNPDGEYKLGQLVRACLGMYDSTTAYSVPIIYCSDSMKNDYHTEKGNHSISPTLLVTIVGKVDDIRKCVSSDFKKSGDIIYVLGKTRNELGGSEYFRLFNGIGNEPPELHPDEHVPLYKAISDAICDGLVSSAHDVSDGGISVAFAECAIGGGAGADIDLSQIPSETDREDALLFSESPGRFVVSVPAEKADLFERAMKGTLFAKVGRVRGDKRAIIRYGDRLVLNEDVGSLKEAYYSGIR